MRNIIFALVLILSTILEAQTPTRFTWDTKGSTLPDATKCVDLADAAKRYTRVNAASPNGALYVCENISAGVYGWVLAGTPSLQSTVKIIPGSSRVLVNFTSSASCTLALYTEQTRTTLSADTTAGANQMDSRTGNIITASDRQFLLGTVSALSPSTSYWYKLTCGSRLAVGSFKTLPSLGSSSTTTIRYSSAITGEHSASADMSSPTAISSSTIHYVTISSGSVRYYRANGGSIFIFIAR